MKASSQVAPQESNATIGYLAVVLATACWGTSGIFVNYIFAASDVDAMPLAFWRDLTTFFVLLIGVGLLSPRQLRVQKQDLRWLIALGSGLGVFHVFWNLAVMLNGAAVATVQQAAMPAIVAVVAWSIWREPLTWRKMVAIILTFAGTVLVSGLDELGQAEFSLSGLLVGLGLPVAYAGYSLFGKKVRQTYSPATILVYAFGFGALTLLPFQFFVPQPFPVSGEAVLWFSGMIALATIVPWFVFTFSLGRLPASVASILAMAEIPFVALYAYFLLDEQMALVQIVGAVLVVIGVVMLVERKHKAPATTK